MCSHCLIQTTSKYTTGQNLKISVSVIMYEQFTADLKTIRSKPQGICIQPFSDPTCTILFLFPLFVGDFVVNLPDVSEQSLFVHVTPRFVKVYY